MKQGLLYIFTGDGKGKTSAALGVALRACCANLKVAWVAWYKQASWQTCESNIAKLLPIDVFLLGKGFHLKTKIKELKIKKLKTEGIIVDLASETEHKLAAQTALAKAVELLRSEKYDVLICDEINNALYEKLISLKSVKALIGLRKKTHLVLTGRNAHPDIIALADLVTDMKKVKHPYDQGIPALEGLDF